MNQLPSDIDDIFGNALQPEANQPALAAPTKEARREARAKVKWVARVQLPDGTVVQMRVCDISESGIGLVGEIGIPPNAVLTCAVAVPGLNDPRQVTTVVGTIRTTHATVRGLDLIYGGTWVNKDASARDLLLKWIRRLRS